MRVVVVNESVPYPPTAGNRIRTYNLLVRLAKRHQITYVCRPGATPQETAAAREQLSGQGIEMITFGRPAPRRRGLSLYARAGANLLSSLPYAVSSHNSSALRRGLQTLAGRGGIDLFQFEWLAYADAVQAPARKLIVAHNIESLIWKRYAQHATSSLHQFYMAGQYAKYRAFERRMFDAVDGVVCVSRQDADLARSEFLARHVWVVDNGIDREFFSAVQPTREEYTILFLGSLDWRPNQDAVRLLVRDILPHVRQAVPKAKLKVVGRMPPRWLKKVLAEAQGVELSADVPDVRPYLAKASVMAVPLRVGGGSRLKILEALAAGLPVVSTAVGCEGLELMAGREICLAEHPGAFADTLVWALQNPEAAARMAQTGRTLVCEKYDWDALAKRMESVWQEVVTMPQTRAVAAPAVEPGDVALAL
jgi:glycosyltransferase involved in cell wall biosynthesis